jgi:hypothetical protein
MTAPARIPEPRDSADRTVPCPTCGTGWTWYDVDWIGVTYELCTRPRCTHRMKITGRSAAEVPEPPTRSFLAGVSKPCGRPGCEGRTHAQRVFCSRDCSEAVKTARLIASNPNRRPEPRRTCARPDCGEPVKVVDGRPRTYCGPTCTSAAKREHGDRRWADHRAEVVAPVCRCGCGRECPRKPNIGRNRGVRYRTTATDACLSKIRRQTVAERNARKIAQAAARRGAAA